ncbi:TetR family transcriptional regulator [Mycobacterium asiaticum]|uniref:TetR family transcriptional regulator n=1 Tax=Mycobacterium asiaticum TaxID=1790 RepID=A0A1A3NM57_MYCAS|nr:TetR/AcrR family transcriptional regulator C-terminal domain-containing protein [Mycobacterium asiaticum]OBK22906.1 TetR family transcriptional regulator [Mycobacterium asiaticum]
MSTANGPSPAGLARRGRPRKGASQLSRQAILQAALEAIDEGGAASVTIRSVARQLGVDAKSLYNHVDGIDGLLDAVAEHILGRITVAELTGDTREDLRAIAFAFRTATLSHPQAATLVLTRQLPSHTALTPIESVLAVLCEAGFAPGEAVHLMRTYVAALTGTILREVNAAPAFGVTDAAAIAHRRAVLEQSGLPHVAEAAAHLARFDAEAEFEFTVNLAVENILSRR